jgi:uncharacterized repeat protein (TIGR03803 family)
MKSFSLSVLSRVILSRVILFGVISLMLIASAFAQSPSPTLLFSFPCNQNFVCPDGYYPISLIESPDGNFYGTAVGGGVGMNAQGTVFKMTPAGQVSVIYSFAEESNGLLPYGSGPNGLVEGTDGFLYGVATFNGPLGVGTAFRLSKSGTIEDLHDFCKDFECSDGAYPAFVTQALDGNFYGTTGPSGYPADVLFRLNPKGTFKVMHVFGDPKKQPDGDGAFGLLQAPDGNFYSTTVAGAQNSPFNTVFRFTPNSDAYKILHGFDFSDYAASNLAQTPSGELYGLQVNSELYKIGTSGKYQALGALSSTQYLDGDILTASDGNLWGNFQGGDCSDQGMVFAATPKGKVLQNIVFDCQTIGETLGPMIQAADGKFYGVTLGNGGVSQTGLTNGTIWVMDAGLPAPKPTVVNFAPASGKAGTSVLLQGQHFVGTTAVSFDGVPAKFQVLTANYIRATVPSGAKTGKIAVTNAGGATQSAKSFEVP